MKDVLQAMEKLGVEVMTNANEAMHTSNTNAGEELMPAEQLTASVMDVIPEYSTFVNESVLPGYHGMGMKEIEARPIIGDAGFFNGGSAEHTGTALAVGQATNKLATDKVTITQKKYDMQIDVSNEIATFNVLGAEEFERRIRDKIAKAMVRTIEAAIINGDTVTAATGNVNSDDGAPAANSYYLLNDGLRKLALADSDLNFDLGALDVTDFITLQNAVGDYAANPEDCLWLMNRSTYNQAQTLSHFAKANERGQASTVSGGAITNVYGSDLFIARDMGKTEADGKISVTAANNTKGQMAYLWKPSIQYGFGDGLRIKLFDYGSKGYQLDAWFYFGFEVVNKAALQTTDGSFALGYNITV